MDLGGKTAIVTGAGSGIGRELARAFAREGANVVCCGRTLSRLDEMEKLLGELQAQLSPAAFAAAQERGRDRDLRATITDLLTGLRE